MSVPTVGRALVRGAELWPDAEVAVYPDRRHTYSALLRRSRLAARSLVGLGIEPGERIGILMPNCLEFLEVFFGAHLAGIVPVTVNARYKPKELRHVAADAELAAIVTTDLVSEYVPFADLLRRAFAEGTPPSLRTLVSLGTSSPKGFVDQDGWDAAAKATDPASVEDRAEHEDTAVIMYTSGTTSSPRGCPLSHGALMRTAECVAERLELTERERFWDPLPLFHMAGLLPTLANVLRGGAMLSLTHIDADTALRQLTEEKATFAYPAFPTITQSIIHHPGFATADVSRVRAVLDSSPAETLRQVQAAFPHAKVISSYGLTEAGGVITYSHLDDPLEARITTSGRPFPGMRVAIVDPVTEQECPLGMTGEIRLSGPGMFDGYLNDPRTTAERTDAHGRLRTGDLGSVDEDGRITYTSRLKDMLKVGGENVAAAEIESHLAQHPAVKLAAVVGVADPRLQEVPVAFVELAPGCAAEEDELIAFCRGELAGFKVPRKVWFRTEWPMSATKIQKYRLREFAAKERSGQR
ncbi:hypothetical protein BAY61_24610 [Prauserella marina]|uniref:Fatty-acyl-CoA synthase/long-chain acyl-CoA synthetase n=1 Tax=Prauserella marina TaxID=530584 RepID=A0A222VUR2_9PSEU|nr:class I adenylate-forming enzyme family protein [Prauserella marina]ASR37658.1 hypothetical protein BAY61_24610 [Prauserella marina]PWV75580.1 fatty-acyl-CoA synthase/long-chain acyl-CoA synthetase [Prauserella marina]SDD31397.1 fatty-acyl-CoA synthase/long-chain acyl-CoA synthetase [Prauserella marina]